MTDYTALTRDITLYKDVGFDRTYKHIINFDTIEQQTNYFENINEKTTYLKVNYIPKTNILKISMLMDSGLYTELQTYTYCSFRYGSKITYWFVDEVFPISPSVAGIRLIEDYWNMYLFDKNGNKNFYLGESSIEREHVDRWVVDSDIPSYKKMVVEDKDISVYEEPVVTELVSDTTIYSDYIATVILSYVDSNSKIVNLIIPFLKPGISISGFMVENNGMSTRANVFTSEEIATGEFITKLSITPETVVSITVTSSQSFAWLYRYDSSELIALFRPSTILLEFNTINSYGVYNLKRAFSQNNVAELTYRNGTDKAQILYTKEWVKPIEFTNNQPTLASNKYEPIMWCYPYVDRAILDYSGTRIHQLSDNFVFTDIEGFMLIMIVQSSNSSIGVYITNNFETGFKAFMKANIKGLACMVQSPSIDIPSNTWLSYVNTSRTTDRELIMSQSIQGAIEGIVSGATVGAFTGNPLLGVVSAIGGPVEAGFNFYNQEIKEKSIRNMAQSLLFDGTGDSVLQTTNLTLSLSEMKCNKTVYDIAYDRYKKYGYKVNRIGIPDLKSRKYFNFIKTSFCQIEGKIPNNIKIHLETIFNNGVTLWHYDNITLQQDNILEKNYDYENIERSLCQ